jgi:hypothetical protein
MSNGIKEVLAQFVDKNSIGSQSYPNLIFSFLQIFPIKLGHFKVQTIFSYATNTQA